MDEYYLIASCMGVLQYMLIKNVRIREEHFVVKVSCELRVIL